MSARASGSAMRRRQYPNGERYALRMWVSDGQLHYDQLRLRIDVVDDAPTAIASLRDGQIIWLLQNGPLVTTVQHAFEELIQNLPQEN